MYQFVTYDELHLFFGDNVLLATLVFTFIHKIGYQ